MSDYKNAIITELNILSDIKETVFIGYNTAYGSRMYHTLDYVAPEKCIEMPVAENLMMGMAMGMSLTGYRPVVCFERHDFLLPAMDAILNHLDKLPTLSGGQFTFPVVIRAIVGSKKSLDPGIQHTQDYTDLLIRNSKLQVYTPTTKKLVAQAYSKARSTLTPIVIVEYRELY